MGVMVKVMEAEAKGGRQPELLDATMESREVKVGFRFAYLPRLIG